jgi:hypothetical protein
MNLHVLAFLLNPQDYLRLYEMTAKLQDQALAALREHVADKDYQQVQADFLKITEKWCLRRGESEQSLGG